MGSIDEKLQVDSQIEGKNRREFMRLVSTIGTGVLAGFNPFIISKAEAQRSRRQKQPRSTLSEKALLYDIYLSSFNTQKSASSEQLRIKRVIGKLRDNVKVLREGNSYKVVLDVNTIAGHADRIVNDVRNRGISKDAYKKMKPYFFHPNSTQRRFSFLFVENDIGYTVRKYTTAYGADVQTTVNALISMYGRTPRNGDFVAFPVRFLKTPYQRGLRLGTDYNQITLDKGKSLWTIVSAYTEGDFEKNYEIVRKFNAIMPDEVRDIAAGIQIMVPYRIYKDPLKPTIVADGTGKPARIIREAPTVSIKETPTEAKEREDTIIAAVPEMGSINDYLDDVRSQSLGVLKNEMPAVLSESFNIRNPVQHEFYSKESNLRELAESYGRGIISYLLAHPQVTKVITDNGHGTEDPGAPGANNKSEGYFTREIQKHIGNFLRREGTKVRPGLQVFPLNYTGPADPRDRIMYYIKEANRIGNSDDSVYLSVHIDSMNQNATPPPRMFVLNQGRQPRSRELAANMLAHAVPFYEITFRQ